MCSIVLFKHKRGKLQLQRIFIVFIIFTTYRYFYSKTFKQILTCTELQRRTPVKITKRPVVGTKLDHDRVSRGYIVYLLLFCANKMEDLCFSLRIQIGNLWWCFLCLRPCLHNHDRRVNVLLRFCLSFTQSGSFWKTRRYDKGRKGERMTSVTLYRQPKFTTFYIRSMSRLL